MAKSILQRTFHVIVLLMALIYEFSSSSAQEISKCSSKPTCSSCIQAAANCAWCRDKNIGLKSLQRCDAIDKIENECTKSEIVYPRNNSPNKRSSKRITSQLQPEFVSLEIRPHSPYNIVVTFQEVANYPVDLYYLMDLSYSMSDDKEKLRALGNELGNTIRRITPDFRIGFGSFVDKIVSPFVNVHPERLKNPCYNSVCARPYGFINHMSLTNDSTKFTQGVARSEISGNVDTPEGGFDAMMQAIVCKKEIGWRTKARKILLVATDAAYHHAGDGKWGGVIIPNDGLCHLDGFGKYTKSTEQDYPSVGQIQKKVVENDINVIFVATEDVKSTYIDLSKVIKGSQFGTLSKDSSNILGLVRELYKKIKSTVELRDNSTNNVKVTYESVCSNNQGPKKQTNKCSGLSTETKVEFTVGIELVSCPEKKSERRQILEISPVGLSESLIVELKFLCECDCEQTGQQEVDSVKCNGNGIWACGICKCDEGRFGETCECDNVAALSVKDDKPCKMGNSTTVCSGRGQCICGKCTCNKINRGADLIYGPFCECDNFNCAKNNELICGGNGECNCGRCNCYPGYQGIACECPTTDDYCVGPNMGVCSEQGTCDCGKCKCLPSFGGKFCEENLTPGGKCIKYRKCAECLGFPKNIVDQSECIDCNSTFSVEMVTILGEPKQGEHKCEFKDATGCNFFFSYISTGSDAIPLLTVQKLTVCPKPLDLFMVIGSVAGITLFIGIVMLIIWKIVTCIKDAREYEKFMMECANVKWAKNENPLFRKPMQRFSNPMFGRLGDRITKRFSRFKLK